MSETAAPMLTFREVTKDTWPDFERLFESRGGPKACWCMVWRPMPRPEKGKVGATRKVAMSKIVNDNRTSVGILGYTDDEPVAWCSIAPRETYRPGIGGPYDAEEPPGAVWSLGCFFISRAFRGKGITRQLIIAAVDHARSNGARVVEAYPIDPDSPSYRFMGYIDTFKDMGFTEVGRAGTRRYVVQLSLSEEKASSV